jgi:hypothetical protein
MFKNVVSLCYICFLIAEFFEIFALLICCAVWVGLSLPFQRDVSSLSWKTLLRYFILEDWNWYAIPKRRRQTNLFRAKPLKSENLNYMEAQVWNFAAELLASGYPVINYTFKLLTATHAEFLACKVALGQVSLRLLRISSVSNIAPILPTHVPFIHHQRYIGRT